MPSPNCSPARTDCGTSRTTRVIQPLAPRPSRTIPIRTPDNATASGLICVVSITAAIAFIGWTGTGSR